MAGSKLRQCRGTPMHSFSRNAWSRASLMLSATQLLHHMGNIFRDNVPEDSTSTGLHIDHKRLQALQEKRIALGHRPDDHVEQTMGGMTMR